MDKAVEDIMSQLRKRIEESEAQILHCENMGWQNTKRVHQNKIDAFKEAIEIVEEWA